MPKKPSKRGGARAGAGRPAIDGAAVKRYQVMLDDATVEALRFLGNGNLSLGIRISVTPSPSEP